jgi:antitoxin ParD1/3/4
MGLPPLHEDWIHEVKLARLREQLKVGIDQLDRGEGIAIESKPALDSLLHALSSGITILLKP